MEEYSIIKKFSENCGVHPNDLAIVDVATNIQMSYHELDVASGRVYRYLIEHNIGKEDVVMILLPRGAKPFVTIVGVWKAGAAYVMLEAEYPEQKREFIKKDANCKLVIDNIVFDEMMKCEPMDGYKVANPHDLSYIVYTSGTTGNPKGVMHEYGTQFLDVKSWQNKGQPIFNHDDRVIQLTPLNFTATVMLLHTVIDVGATLVIITLETMKNTNMLIDIMDKYKITTGFFTPSLIRIIPQLPKSITKIVMGGEPSNGLFFKEINSYNMYALSESGFVLLAFFIDKSYETIPSGKATIEETEICLMNEDGFPVENGEVGEICYKNPYFRGYLNLPDKNATVFRNGYVRSGDLARILPDSNILILGRSDDMVKINGNRVEPAEIEVVVKEVLGTEWVGVKVFTEKKNNFVCAYYIGEPVISIEEAKKIISKKLVSYMQPAFYIKIDKIPLNANGKFKRNELPAPDFKSYQKEYVAPSNELEEKLCNVFASVLNLERVGVMDDFYEIGGDSINAIKVITKMNLVALDVNILMKGRTAKKIIELYNEISNENKHVDFDKRNEDVLNRDHQLMAEQKFIFDSQIMYPKSTLWNVSVLFRFNQDVDVIKLKNAIDTVLKAHPVFSTKLVFNDENILVQRYDKNINFDTKIENISEYDFVDEMEKLVQPFYMINSLLYRIRLFKTDFGGYLFFDIHHSIVAGTSLHILFNDICDVYDGKSLNPDYYFMMLEDREKLIKSSLYSEAKDYYEKTFENIDWCTYFKPDFDTKENVYGHLSFLVPKERHSFNKLNANYGISKNEATIIIVIIAIAIYNNTNNIKVSWVYNGRESLNENNAIGTLFKDMYVGVCLNEKMTLVELFKQVKEQIKNNIYYSCYPYPDPEKIDISENWYDTSVLFQSNLRSFETESSLKLLEVELPQIEDKANNLINVEILDRDDYNEMYIDYNLKAYKKETIYKIKNLILKTTYIIAKHISDKDYKVFDIIEQLKK